MQAPTSIRDAKVQRTMPYVEIFESQFKNPKGIGEVPPVPRELHVLEKSTEGQSIIEGSPADSEASASTLYGVGQTELPLAQLQPHHRPIGPKDQSHRPLSASESQEFVFRFRVEGEEFRNLWHTLDMDSKLDKMEEICRLEETCKRLQNDNHRLTNRILDMTSPQQLLHTREWYIFEFKEIGKGIESWVAKEIGPKPMKRVSSSERHALIAEISTWDEAGRNDVKAMRALLPRLLKNKEKKIVLTCHVIAVLVFENVFNRFAFGFTRAQSDHFKLMESDLFTYEKQFTKFLDIRRMIGQSSLRRPGLDQGQIRDDLIKSCLTVLQILLPATSDETAVAFATKYLDKAISLRHAMTQEQAVYKVFMVEAGRDFQDQYHEVREGEESAVGKVLLCTFPGLTQLGLSDDGVLSDVSLVKASIKLEGSGRKYKACVACQNVKRKCNLGARGQPAEPPCLRCRMSGRVCVPGKSARSGRRYALRKRVSSKVSKIKGSRRKMVEARTFADDGGEINPG